MQILNTLEDQYEILIDEHLYAHYLVLSWGNPVDLTYSLERLIIVTGQFITFAMFEAHSRYFDILGSRQIHIFHSDRIMSSVGIFDNRFIIFNSTI